MIFLKKIYIIWIEFVFFRKCILNKLVKFLFICLILWRWIYCSSKLRKKKLKVIAVKLTSACIHLSTFHNCLSSYAPYYLGPFWIGQWESMGSLHILLVVQLQQNAVSLCGRFCAHKHRENMLHTHREGSDSSPQPLEVCQGPCWAPCHLSVKLLLRN